MKGRRPRPVSNILTARISPGAVQLPGVEQVVPDTVEAPCDGRDRGHESISHPYCEDGVFLSEGLSCRDGCPVPFPYPLPGPELDSAAQEGDSPQACQVDGWGGAVHYGPRGHGDGEHKRDAPQVEGEVLELEQPCVEPWHQVPYKEGCKTGEYQQREDLGQDHARRSKERDSFGRVHEGDEDRDEHGGGHVYYYGVGRESRHVTSELARDYRRCRGCRADETEHCSLYQDFPVEVRQDHHGQGQVYE